MTAVEPTRRDHALGFGLCCAYLALLLATANDIGLARDEGIYVVAADRYGAWLEALWKSPTTALTRAQTDAAFSYNHEHPPLMKLLFGLSQLAQRATHVFSTDSAAYRFPGMLSAGLLVWLLYIFGARLYGRAAGVFAACMYALLPRPFYHAHLLAFDVPVTCASTFAIYAYYRTLQRPRSAPLAGIAFGLALLIKHNSWLLPGMFGLHFVACALLERRARRAGQGARLSLVPYGLFAMIALGPALFIAGWPWLWHDMPARLREYAAFHLNHAYYNMEYFGVNYFWPPFPMSYAWVMTLFTVPLTSLLLGLTGAVRAIREALREREPAQPTLLLVGCMLAPLILISVPTTPIFGGTKHWFPAYPLLALFAGRVFSELVQRFARRHVAWTYALGAWLLTPAAVETAHSHPFALTYYTPVAGGVPGAAELGMNRQFWGYTTRSLVPYLLRALPNGGSLYVCDTIFTAFQMLIRDGHLPPTFRVTGDISQADYALVHHEKHFAEVDHQIWTTYRTVQPAHVLLYDGVPVISVYKNPRR